MNDKKVIGAGIIAIDRKTGRILMGRRSLTNTEPNTWAPFGGTYENEDKIPRKTAIREFVEETQCNIPFQLSHMPFYINDDNHVKFYTYVGLLDDRFPVKINNESRDYEWFDIKMLPDNLHPGVQEMLQNKKDELLKFISLI